MPAGLAAALNHGAGPDTYDLIDELVVLAARHTDVDALNAGAQQIRRAADELGTEHTYALPGGDRLSLAAGDAVRVRVNDYRSRRGEGPDLLNGYRAVVSEIAQDGGSRSPGAPERAARTIPTCPGG
ncbi:hypothetical protein ACF1BU_28095 [Streptomyces sp. NPDC014724]|uniref:hypothetical protein n=1 Tax=unclassified Streptomyces TaxID=2593676 RepID=UPI0036FE36A1